MIKDKVQEIQDEEYGFPYHYVSKYHNGFTQTFNDSWGINYVSTIEFILSALSMEKFNSIVDIGCGDGRLTFELQQQFGHKHILGIDYSTRAINLAQAMNPSGQYMQCDITALSASQKFDIAILMEVFEHIPPDDADRFVRAVANLLHPNGILYVTVPHINKPLEYKHYRHFSSESLMNAFKDSFSVEKVVYFEKIDRRKDFIDKLLTNKFFILNHNGAKKYLYAYYKKHLFHASHEKECKRIFMKLRSK